MAPSAAASGSSGGRGGGGGAAAAAAAGARLTPAEHLRYLLALPAMLALFLAGAAGLVIIMDFEVARPYLRDTAFARNWVWLVNKNAFFQPFCVNFGAIGFFYCASKLVAHYRSQPAPAADKKRQ